LKIKDTKVMRAGTVPYDNVRQLHTADDWLDAWYDLCEQDEPTEAALAGLLHVAFEHSRIRNPRVLRTMLSVAMVPQIESDEWNSPRERLRSKAVSVIDSRFLAINEDNWKSIRECLRRDTNVLIELLRYLIFCGGLGGNPKNANAFFYEVCNSVIRETHWPWVNGYMDEDGAWAFTLELREQLRGHEILFLECMLRNGEVGNNTIMPDEPFREALRAWVFRPDEHGRIPESLHEAMLMRGRSSAAASLLHTDNSMILEAQKARERLPKKSKNRDTTEQIKLKEAELAQVRAIAFKPPQT